MLYFFSGLTMCVRKCCGKLWVARQLFCWEYGNFAKAEQVIKAALFRPQDSRESQELLCPQFSSVSEYLGNH